MLELRSDLQRIDRSEIADHESYPPVKVKRRTQNRGGGLYEVYGRTEQIVQRTSPKMVPETAVLLARTEKGVFNLTGQLPIIKC